ncbi:MAG TPA: hypothetical protein VF344_05235 [Candidatus Limnocylindrales bacterium]
MSIGLVLAAVGLVNAGTGAPSTIDVTRNGLTVSASGTWSWPEMDTNPKLSYTGFTVSWGDLTSGNTLGAYHLGDGTAATNFVSEIATQGDAGPWGPVGHTYATAGNYTICVIIYDLGEVKPFKAIGYHGLKASGTSRNSDNSVDKQSAPPVVCSTVNVVEETPAPTAQETQAPSASPVASATPVASASPVASPTPVSAQAVVQAVAGITATTPPIAQDAVVVPVATDPPFELFQGETAGPVAMPPSTDTGPGSGPARDGGPSLPILLLLSVAVVSALFAITLKSARAARK